MDFSPFIVVFACFLLINKSISDQSRFDTNYVVSWGKDHVIAYDKGQQVQLSMDQSSGAGFRSKLSYGSGYFHMRIKVPNKNSAGVVTAFYLSSNTSAHDEVDFEFLGNNQGKPITLQTNVFANGEGNREQRTLLWFDPTADFHSYKILWNPYHIVFYVENVPIREFKNYARIGVGYPSQPMNLIVSLWNGDSWATDGGRTKIDWTQAPFEAHFQDFDIVGCPFHHNCYSPYYWWNDIKFWNMNPSERRQYNYVRNKYMNYDYCSDKSRFPTPPPECLQIIF